MMIRKHKTTQHDKVLLHIIPTPGLDCNLLLVHSGLSDLLIFKIFLCYRRVLHIIE